MSALWVNDVLVQSKSQRAVVQSVQGGLSGAAAER